jgi:YidC/Oxa1 family membrane protein insertase
MEPQQPLFDRRQLVMMLVTGVILMLWMPLAPRLFPGLFGVKPDAAAKANDPAAKAPDDKAAEKAQPDKAADAPIPETKPAVAAEVKAAPEVAPAPALVVDLKEGPPVTHLLGSVERGKGFLLQVQLTSKGGAVEWAKLNDERYSTLEDRAVPLKILGNRIPAAVGDEPDSFQTAIESIDAQIQKISKSTRTAHWELLPGANDKTATFRLTSPDGTIAVRKTYRLHEGDEKQRDDNAKGYLLDLELEIENLTDVPMKQTYKLQGPVGLPLENVVNARNFVELKAETYDDPLDESDVTAISRTAGEVLTQFDKARQKADPSQVDAWRDPLHFVGVDVQFFAALIRPATDQLLDANKDNVPDAFLEVVRPMVITRDKAKPERSDISVMLTSRPIEIAAKSTVKHNYEVYLGPKRVSLLRPLGVESALNFGRLALITKTMIWILQFFHHTCFLPYGLAIILLTFTVRMFMLPLTKKQVYDGEKMKVITPEITKLREKYKDEPIKFATAQKELMRRYNHNMFGGCLPLFLQLPIFISLYNALYTAVDLRMAKFLWINNLAAPDALFSFGRELPLIGSSFNILPILNVFLFLFQQKQMMPPPTNDEERMRNKMMSFMTVFMGYLFYAVPSGLCLYFIASSLLGMAERHLLKKVMPASLLEPVAQTPELVDPNRPKSFFERLLAQAQEAADAAKHNTDNQSSGRPKNR